MMIYATGDLHGNSLRFQPQYFPEQAEMTKDDYMIVCGDSGCVWNGDKSDDPQLNRLEALPFTVLFVDGNHENFDALNEYPVEQWHGGKVHTTTTGSSMKSTFCSMSKWYGYYKNKVKKDAVIATAGFFALSGNYRRQIYEYV